MLRPRVIPVLLLQGNVLVKTVRFTDPIYIGDPINAVRIFNDLKADELVFLDITATREGRTISTQFVKEVGEEADMPFSVGGGINSIEAIQRILATGAERVIIGTKAVQDPEFIREASNTFGSSSIAVCVDVKKKLLGGTKVFSESGKRSSNYSPVEFAQLMEKMGAGELIVQSIEKDGTMAGYDVDLIRQISETVRIPVVALGGAGSPGDLRKCWKEGLANGLAGGSMFVFQGTKRGVLISYPEKSEWM